MSCDFESTNSSKLDKLIIKHQKWLASKFFGKQLNLRCCKIVGADFSSVCLHKAKFENVHFVRCSFNYSDLTDADLTGCEFESCTFYGVRLSDEQRKQAIVDLSCKPFYMYGHLNCSKRDMENLAYHFVSMNCRSSEINKYQDKLRPLANSSNMAKQHGKL